jgi:HEAT repeat protein
VTRRTFLGRATAAAALLAVPALIPSGALAANRNDEKKSDRKRGKKDMTPRPVELSPEQTQTITQLLQQLQDKDAAVRMKAAQGAGPIGYIAVPSLQPLLLNADSGIATAAEVALKSIVHHAARPGASEEADLVTQQLLQWVLAGSSLKTQALALQMLQVVGTERAAPVLERTLLSPPLRQDALLALERIPGRNATKALARARKKVDPEFRPQVEQAIRRRADAMKNAGTKAGKS